MRYIQAVWISLWTLSVATSAAYGAVAVSRNVARALAEDVMLEREQIPSDKWFERAEVYVLPRQASSSASSSSSSAAASSSSSSSSSTSGGSVNVSSSSAGCSMSNNLSAGQSASWTDSTASTCCTNATATTCFFRMQSSVSATTQCIIPNCNRLASGDSEQMAGFKPLSTTTGSGSNNNTFAIHSGSAALVQMSYSGAFALTAASCVFLAASAMATLV